MSHTTSQSQDSGSIVRRANSAISLGMSGSDRALPDLELLAGDAADSVRAAAAEGLGLLHTPDALPVLDRLLDDPSPQVARNTAAAMYLLASLPEALPSIRKMVGSRHADVRREAMGCVLQLDLDQGMELLTAGLTDAEEAIRLAASETFLLLACSSTTDVRQRLVELVSVPERLQALRNNDVVLVRRIFATALGNLGEFVPAEWFESLARDPDGEVRHQTARSIVRSGAHAARHLLEGALSDPEPCVCIAAVQSLLQWDGCLLVSWLHQLLKSPDRATRAYAVRLADEFGPDEAIPLLEEALGDPDSEVAGTAATGLLALRPEPAIAWFRKTAETGSPEDRGSALQRAGTALMSLPPQIGAPTREATSGRADVRRLLVEFLGELVEHADSEVRAQAARELMSGVGIAESEPLRAALQDPDRAVRAVAADDLHTTPDVDLLVQSLSNEAFEVRRAAISGLRLTRGADLIGPLTAALDDDDFEVRWCALELLGYMGRRIGLLPHRACWRRMEQIADTDELTMLREFVALNQARVAQRSILPAVQTCWANAQTVLGVYACCAVDLLLRRESAEADQGPSAPIRRAEQAGDEIRVTAPLSTSGPAPMLLMGPAGGAGLRVDQDALARVSGGLADQQASVSPAVARLVSDHLDTCRGLPTADPEAWVGVLLAPYRQAAASFVPDPSDADSHTDPLPIEPAIEDWIVQIEPVLVGCAWVIGLPWVHRDLADTRGDLFELLDGLQALARRLGHAHQASVLGLAQAGLVACQDDARLHAKLLEHEDVNVRAAAAAAMLEQGADATAGAVDVLHQACAPNSGAPPEVVLHGALALAVAGHSDATAPAARLLVDESPMVRDLAIRTLAAMGQRAESSAIRQAMAQADSLMAKVAVAEAFVDQGWDVPEPVLRAQPATPTETVAMLLLRCRLDDREAWRELAESLEDAEMNDTVLCAVQGIGRVRIRAGIPSLQIILKHLTPTKVHALASAGLMEMDTETGSDWIGARLRGQSLEGACLGIEAALIAGRNLMLCARGLPRHNQGRFLT